MSIDPKLIDVFPKTHDGYPDDLAAEDTPDVLRDVCGSASRDFPDSWWIEPSDWADAARDNDKHGTWALNFTDRYTWQGNSHECTCHSLSRCFESARNKQRGAIYPDGPVRDHRYEKSAERDSVWVSPLSVYAEANPRIRGGANVRQVMEIACKRGMLPEPVQPRDYGFKHTLIGTAGGKSAMNQSDGRWVALRDFPQGWQETAQLFKPKEVIFPEDWQQAVCLVLHGHMVGVGRKGHAVPWAKWDHANQVMAYPDSYLVTRYDSVATVKNAWRGSFAIVSVTAPDDWANPAGLSASGSQSA